MDRLFAMGVSEAADVPRREQLVLCERSISSRSSRVSTKYAASSTTDTTKFLRKRVTSAQPLQAEGHMAKYGKAAGKRVKSAMHRKKKGTLKSGSGRKVKSRKQAIAIGLSEARKKGAKVPKKKKSKR